MSVTSAFPREQAIARILELTGQPATKTETPWLVITVGLPGSGKSTFARKLAAATGAIILESDALRRDLFGAPKYEPDESRQLFEALYGAARRILEGSSSVIVDATNLREADRQAALDVAAAIEARTLVLHFRAPERVIFARLAQRDRSRDPEDKSTAGLAVYARLAETEQSIRGEHWKIDTSDAGATEAALLRATTTLTARRRVAEANTLEEAPLEQAT